VAALKCSKRKPPVEQQGCKENSRTTEDVPVNLASSYASQAQLEGRHDQYNQNVSSVSQQELHVKQHISKQIHDEEARIAVNKLELKKLKKEEERLTKEMQGRECKVKYWRELLNN